MSNLLSERPDIERIAVSQGSAPAHYCLVRPMTSGGDCYGELIIDCKDYNTVMKQIPEVRRILREKYPDAYIRCRKYNFSISTSHTVEVEFAGPDPAVLYLQQDALRSGVGRSDIANALMAATDGMPVGVINEQDRTIIVNMLVRNEDGSRISDLNDIPVWSMMNLHLSNDELNSAIAGGKGMSELQDKIFRSTPLSRVAKNITMEWDEDVVMRMNGQRVIEAECDPNTEINEATAAKVVESIKKDIEAIELPAGYSMRWVGEGEIQGEAINNLMKYVPITIFIILAILLVGKRLYSF